MFRGITNLNLDGKGRLAMPTRHRERFARNDGQMVVTIDMYERCLLVYPLDTWLEIEEAVDRLPSFNRMANRLRRMLVGHATDLTLDAAGRVLIPSELRAYAGLEKSAVLMGQGKKLELWDQAHWDEVRQEIMHEDEGAMPPEMESLSL
ncbi:MAG: division/cell wall cluster transcriptional repressor MraZ [Halothiobacillaceae bacterium]